jgi:hypothetical protein
VRLVSRKQIDRKACPGDEKIENLIGASSAGRLRFLCVIKALEAGNIAVPVGVWRKSAVRTGFPTGSAIATSWTMNKETQRSPDRIDSDIRAADALERARLMPPGPERNEALKRASLLRCTADARGLTFAKRGRPPK